MAHIKIPLKNLNIASNNPYIMFENLLNLVKEHAGDAIVNNPAIPNEHNEAAMETTASSMMSQLKSLGSGGGISSIIDMFNGGQAKDHEVVKGVETNVAGDLMSKFGINPEQAGSIVKSLIPVVMSKMVSKTNDPEDKSFDLQSILGSLGGNSGGLGGMMDSVKKLF